MCTLKVACTSLALREAVCVPLGCKKWVFGFILLSRTGHAILSLSRTGQTIPETLDYSITELQKNSRAY